MIAHQRHAQIDLAYFGRDSVALDVVARVSERAESLAVSLAHDAARLRHGEAASAAYEAVARHARRRDLFLNQAHGAGATLPPHRLELVVLGYWLQMGRVAALRGDRDFLARAESSVVAEGAPALPRLRPEARRALEHVRALVAGDTIGELGEVERALTGALAALGR